MDFKIRTVDIEGLRVKLQVLFESRSFCLLRSRSLWAHVFLQMWDTSGDQRYRDGVEAHYRGQHVFLIVYDITDRVSDIHPSVFWRTPPY